MAAFCDTGLIVRCAEFSNKAYKASSINGVFLENKETDCQAFVVVDDDAIVITGQGSTTMTDWYIDLSIWRRKVPYLNNTLVHAGFIIQYESVRTKMHAEIEKIMKSKKITKIICTGHSLFGAVSTIAALDCAILYDIPVSCVTFGSPRVGGPKFKALFDKLISTSFRCVRHRDPITYTPLPLRFKHVRGGVHFGTKISFDPPLYSFCGCKTSHHSMSRYLSFISNIHSEKTKNQIGVQNATQKLSLRRYENSPDVFYLCSSTAQQIPAVGELK